jgi:hypothetical protein
MIRVLLLGAFTLLGGCASSLAGTSGESRTEYLLGLAKVRVPATKGAVQALDISSLGVGVGESLFIGWRRGQYVFVKPEDCHLLVIIRNKLEAEHALEVMNATKGKHLCLVDFAKEVRRF